MTACSKAAALLPAAATPLLSRLEVVTSFSSLGVCPSLLQVDQKEGQVFLLEEKPKSQHGSYSIIQEAGRLILSC